MALKIIESCINCQACAPLCPSQAIQAAHPHFLIDAGRCTECEGDYPVAQCAAICPVEGAIVDAAGVAINPPGSLTGIPPAQLAAVQAAIHTSLDPDTDPDTRALAQIHATWYRGGGVLPDWLGLEPDAWRRLAADCFPGTVLEDPVGRGPLEEGRDDEFADLEALLLAHRAGLGERESAVARLITAGSMGYNHLWEDLGVWSRAELSGLIRRHFPTLAARNDRDMKWKKFFYRQLCLAEAGEYVCRAPSCGVCPDYADCFGPER